MTPPDWAEEEARECLVLGNMEARGEYALYVKNIALALRRAYGRGVEDAAKVAEDVEAELGESPRAYRHRMEVQAKIAQAIRSLREKKGEEHG